MTKANRSICPICGVAIVSQPGRGQPATYCGDEHRRVAEYRLRRVQGLLARAEKKKQDAGLAIATAQYYSEKERRTAADYWRGEVERLEVELAELLADRPGPRADTA